MKEATGELNMTVITVVAIAAVGAFFYAFVWPAIQNRLQANTICSTASPGMQVGTNISEEGYINCDPLVPGENRYTCHYTQNGKQNQAVTCQFNDAT